MPRETNKASVDLLRQGKEINAKVHQICLFGSTNKQIVNPIASFARLYHDNDLKKKVAGLDKMRAKAMYEASFLYLNEYYNPGIQPTSKKHRDLFIQETINSVATFSLLYGYGNCQPMADIAFLEAIFRDIPHDITYLRFFTKKEPTEELNVIAIGNFPSPGCIMISPWVGTSGTAFLWRGQVKDTPALNHMFDHFDVLFQLSFHSQEREQYKKMLVASQYQDWLQDPLRKNTLAQIRYEFLLSKENTWKQTLSFKNKYVGFFSYRDLIASARTSKSWNEQYLAIKQEVRLAI